MTLKKVIGIFEQVNDAQALLFTLHQCGFEATEVDVITPYASSGYGAKGPIGRGSKMSVVARLQRLRGSTVRPEVVVLQGVGSLVVHGERFVVLNAPWNSADRSTAGSGLQRLLRTLVQSDIPATDAQIYVEAIRRGATLMAVTVRFESSLGTIKTFFDMNNAASLGALAGKFRATGWQPIQEHVPVAWTTSAGLPTVAFTTSSASSVTPVPTLDEIKNRWLQILDKIRTSSPMVFALLDGAIPVDFDGATLVLRATKGRWQKIRLEGDKARGLIESVLTQAFNQAITIRVSIEEQAPAMNSATTASASPLIPIPPGKVNGQAQSNPSPSQPSLASSPPDFSLAEIQAIWPQYLQAIQAEARLIRLQMDGVRPVTIEGRTLVLLAPKGQWQKTRLAEWPPLVPLLAGLLKRQVDIRIVVDEREVKTPRQHITLPPTHSPSPPVIMESPVALPEGEQSKQGNGAQRHSSSPGSSSATNSLPAAPHVPQRVGHICNDLRTGNGCGARCPSTALMCGQCGMSLRFAMEVRDPGTIIGKYRIRELIGYGNYGAVYAAEALGPGKESVALKETFDRASFRAAELEFAVLHHLSHPNLPKYHEVFEFNANGYLVMELIQGYNLDEALRKHKVLGEREVVNYALQLCDTLIYLHGQTPPILHRDIKPANIRITSGGLIKLVDFGLVKAGTALTQASRRALTPSYAPIEQYSGGTDVRSDIYCVGATLYHLLTGEEPLAAPDRLCVDPDPLKSPQRIRPEISRSFGQAILTAMALKQQDRYQGARALRDTLQAIQGDILQRRASRPVAPTPAAIAASGTRASREAIASPATPAITTRSASTGTADRHTHATTPDQGGETTSPTASRTTTSRPARERRTRAWLAAAPVLVGAVILAVLTAVWLHWMFLPIMLGIGITILWKVMQ